MKSFLSRILVVVAIFTILAMLGAFVESMEISTKVFVIGLLIALCVALIALVVVQVVQRRHR